MAIGTKLKNMLRKVESKTFTRTITERDNPPGHMRWLVGIPKAYTDYVNIKEMDEIQGTWKIRIDDKGNRVIDFVLIPTDE